MLPNGDHMEQKFFYENLPKFCSHCRKIGNSLEGCKALEEANNRAKAAATAKTGGGQNEADQEITNSAAGVVTTAKQTVQNSVMGVNRF